MKNYKLFFDEKALREWNALDNTIREQFKKKLKERLINPCIQKDKLSGIADVYKIKLRETGYRLAYRVNIENLKIIVFVIGRRDKKLIYKKLQSRL